jgi:hypothetical protein
MLLDKERVKGREVKRNEVDKVKTTDGAERVNSLRSVSFRNNYFEREVNSFCVKCLLESRRKGVCTNYGRFRCVIFFFGISNSG